MVCLNLVFFTLVTSNYVPTLCPPPPSKHEHHHGGHHGGSSTPVPSSGGKCPIDTLKLAACANVLNGLVHAVVGPPRTECCSLIDGLADLDAALCLCTTLKADLLGVVHLNLPISLNLLLNFCGKAGVPSDFQCPSY